MPIGEMCLPPSLNREGPLVGTRLLKRPSPLLLWRFYCARFTGWKSITQGLSSASGVDGLLPRSDQEAHEAGR